MLDLIIEKIRGLIADITKTDFQTFEYTTSAVFRIALPNATATGVLVNGSASGVTYTYDSTNQDVTVTSSLTDGDVVQVNFSYYKYSETELVAYIRGALVYISVQSFDDGTDYEIEEGDDIYPTPSNRDTDLIALVSSILIKPNWLSYRTPTLEVRYPRTMDKDTKIKNLVQSYKWGLGTFQIIEFD